MLSDIKKAQIPRMQTVNEAAKELCSLDPSTAIMPYHIRQFCLTVVLPTVNKASKKLLLNLNALIEFMENPAADKFQPSQTATDAISGIKRIS